MDLKQLLGKLDVIEGTMHGATKNPTGPKFTGYWKGSDEGTPGTKMVGGGAEQQEESLLKDLSKGLTPKTKEQELAEEYQAFLEAEFKDTVDKRPARKNARPARGHAPQSGYKTVKADEGTMSEKDIELQDYRSMSHKEFQTAYGMTKTEWINQNKALVIQNPDIKRSLGINESHYKWEITFKNGKKSVYHHDSPHYSDATAASDIAYTKKSNPGSKVVATKDGKPFDWESLLNEGVERSNLQQTIENFLSQHEGASEAVAIDAVDYLARTGQLEKFVSETSYLEDIEDLNEDGYYGPVEARWMIELSDDEGQHLKTYVDKFPSLSAAKKAYKNTPYASNFKYKPVKKDTNEAVDSDIVQAMGQDTFNRAGYNPIRDERDYLDKLSQLKNLERKPGLNQAMKDHITQRVRDLNAEAFKKGYIKAESRGHTIIANKLKDIERAKKFASGELKIPTPQERQAQLKQLEKEPKQVKEYGANNPPQNTSPAQAQQVAANLNIQKTALNQLKQINPEIDPQKAAAAMTKDTATMSPQEKDELAQVAKTMGPALGTPAFGSIKTAIQKSQIQSKK